MDAKLDGRVFNNNTSNTAKTISLPVGKDLSDKEYDSDDSN